MLVKSCMYVMHVCMYMGPAYGMLDHLPARFTDQHIVT